MAEDLCSELIKEFRKMNDNDSIYKDYHHEQAYKISKRLIEDLERHKGDLVPGAILIAYHTNVYDYMQEEQSHLHPFMAQLMIGEINDIYKEIFKNTLPDEYLETINLDEVILGSKEAFDF